MQSFGQCFILNTQVIRSRQSESRWVVDVEGILIVQFGRVAKNPPEKGGGTRITITGKSEDEKQVWQTLGVGNEDCVEWVVCCACLNLLE